MKILTLNKFWLIGICLITSGCWDYGFDMGSGYKFVRTHATSHVIIGPLPDGPIDNVIIGADIKTIYYNDSYILGYREHVVLPTPELETSFHQDTGFFIINMQSHEILLGLDQARFDEKIKQLNLEMLADEMEKVKDWLYWWY